MRLIRTRADMHEEADRNVRRAVDVGLVPTMGALHEGHLSLLRRAREENEVVVLSVFVNPTQFDDPGDLAVYPKTWEEDLASAEAAGVDVVFAPEADEMYPPRFQTTVQVHELSKPLCGMSRGAGHFVGVATVVAKLFHLTRPTRAYFGQKDAQQALIVQRMVIDLDFPVEIRLCPIVRESDGLALSSRNRRLPPGQRDAALALRKGLVRGRELLRSGETDAHGLYVAMAETILAEPGVELDYLHLVSPETLTDVERVDDVTLMAGAIRVGDVRLIDNVLVGPDGPWED